ncbi:MAG: hypothetical protein GY868_14165 [Deltaproteobacteria bacterium]|nr:hypothetical protein [Deltaproteobacteria bacterium]
MKCPICSIKLQVIAKSGFKYNYCHKCNGVWLERSELNNIIEHSENKNLRTNPIITDRKTVVNGETFCILRKVQQNSFLGDLFTSP